MSTESSATDRAEIRRQELLKLLEEVTTLGDEDIDMKVAPQKLLEIVNQLADGEEFVNSRLCTQISYLGAKVARECSALTNRLTKMVDCSLYTYNPESLAEEIKKQFLLPRRAADDDDEDEAGLDNSQNSAPAYDWSNLHETIHNIMKYPPMYTHMNGTLNKRVPKEPRQRKPRDAKQKQAGAPKEPDRIETMEHQEDSVEDSVNFLMWALKQTYKKNGNEGINYMQFITDPNDFTKTICNMFYLSFLLNDGRVQWKTDGENLIISPTSSEQIKLQKQKKVPNKQFPISIDHEYWQKAIKELKIKQCLLDPLQVQWNEMKMQ